MKFAVDLRNPYLRTLLAALHEDELKRSEDEMKQNLNALAVKVGELQARIMRLDAFGARLGKAAGIKADEFRFDETPGQGGPAPMAGRDSGITTRIMKRQCPYPSSRAASSRSFGSVRNDCRNKNAPKPVARNGTTKP